MSENSNQPRRQPLDDRRVDGCRLGPPAWFGIGAACGLAFSLLGHGMLIAGGPIFPLTVTHAPIAVVWESAPVMTNPRFLGLLMMLGPVLYGTYFASIYRFGSAAVAVIVVFHVACFVIVCGLRDVRWSSMMEEDFAFHGRGYARLRAGLETAYLESDLPE